ncbi:MAG TPA: ABC transporter permease [Ktedonobacteraceae bacterium]
MEQATQAFSPGAGQAGLPASMTLAFQRARKTWRMLCLVGLGVLASVVVVCAVPLYSQVAMTAGLRATLASGGQTADIVVKGSVYNFSPGLIDETTRSLDQEFQAQLGPYLLPTRISVHSTPFTIMVPSPFTPGKLTASGDEMYMVGTNTTQVGAHLHFVEGQMPSSTISAHTLQIAVRKEISGTWHPGTIIPVSVAYRSYDGSLIDMKTFNLQVTGIFTLPTADDPFWHGEDFRGFARDANNTIFSSLASNSALTTMLTQMAPPPEALMVPTPVGSLLWYYTLDANRIQVGQLDDLLNKIQIVETDNANNFALVGGNALRNIQTYQPTNALQLFHDRLPITRFPITSLTLLILAMALFFVTLMTGILVDRQMGALALLRSRGASGRQIFWSLVTQAGLLGLLALAAGPFLAIALVGLLASHILTVSDQGSFNTLAGNLIPVALGVAPYALVTAGAMALTMILSIWGVANRDVLALRRESARSTHRPFWQRLNLDALVLILALLGAGFAFYLANSNALDSRQRLLFLAPLTLLAALCLLLAAMLILLRGFPLLLRGCSWLATHLRGAPSQIALAQMARAPRQSMRMTLLLALATAFVIFTLVFNASQTQRIQDVSDYQAMADFSGSLPTGASTVQQLSVIAQAFQHLPGVLSVSAGYVKSATAGGAALNLPIDFKAIDTATFAQTARWSVQDSTRSLAELMRQLALARPAALKASLVPAIVDATTWDTLHLAPGASFTLNFSITNTPNLVKFQAIARVAHIPTSGNSSVPTMLADYQSFARVYSNDDQVTGNNTGPINYIWLRSSDDLSLLSALRSQLAQGSLALSPLYDRRQMADQFSREPLYLTLFGILLLGTCTALLLALVGNLVASWLNVSSRLVNFAALRALGASPRQIAATLAWEQIVIYTTAILLGFFFGWLLSVLTLPSLVFSSVLPNQITNSVDSQTFYAAQNTPPIQIVIPPTLWLALAMLIVLCFIALAMMVRVASHPSIAQVLRLNED